MKTYAHHKPHLALFLLLFTLSACQQVGKPDLARLYKTKPSQHQHPPVVLLHGIMGSKLRHSASLDELWFGNLSTLLFSNYESIRLHIDSETLQPIEDQGEPFAIADKAAGIDYYQAIIKTLTQYGAYQLTEINTLADNLNRKLYVFIYDWRQDNVSSACKLHTFIEQIKKDHNNPDLKVDLVAHSMGGLISRYYLRYGETDVLDDNAFPVNQQGAQHVRRVVLLGTPNLGSVGSVHSFITGLRVGLRTIPTEVLVTMPSIYQLFPHNISSWVVNIQGETLDRDVFDVRIWERFQWSIFDPKVRQRIISDFDDANSGQAYLKTLERYFEKHIERARRFLWSLTVRVDNPQYELIVMGGDCDMTPARLLIEEVKGESVTRLNPSDIKKPLSGVDYEALMLEPGDGTVTKASLLSRDALDPTVERHKYSFFPIDYPIFLCEDHGTLTSNINFQDNLLNIVLSH
ncbi:hypothetical protein [Marinicella sp. W31]|uniref:lipase/acyltransferase domain-containing protein n=1 Tax=Marinicella sp. W31 TaxID=3023713 RepID=UPI00375833BA